ncbi:MAG: hypothetical protein DIU63_13320 [Proteobacteria bacterium]|jgi:hypothetical protein|nr:MAG: hypothetical protein DIU63_13320 [Pseudomonadota bacterium]
MQTGYGRVRILGQSESSRMLVNYVLRLGAFLVLATVPLTVSTAHSWYPIECCSGRDCMRVDRVEHMPDGAMLMFAGNIRVRVPKGFTQRPSRDNDTHVCVRENGDGTYVPRCVFVPAGV